MAYTRAQLRTRALNRADANGSGRWDTTAGSGGEVDQLGAVVFDREWRRILNANNTYKFNTVTITSDAVTGRYPIGSLTTGSADAIKRFYRIIGVRIDDVMYEEVPFKEWTLAETLAMAPRVWWYEGDNIMALPKALSKAGVFLVNYIPCRLDSLSSESVPVDFPDGYEDVLVLEWAKHILMKGGAETQEALMLGALAEELRVDMLQDIARRSTNPLRMRYSDSAWDWAG